MVKSLTMSLLFCSVNIEQLEHFKVIDRNMHALYMLDLLPKYDKRKLYIDLAALEA